MRRVYIPKPDGRQRPLGIPTVRDRVVQQAALLILEPIFEAEFVDCSYGFRPGRGAHGALQEIREYVKAGYTASITRPATVGLSAFAKVPNPPKPRRRRATADERFSTLVHPP